MPNNININLLAHIALDSELGGRYGVQGNTFKNTVGYLCQYIQNTTNTDPKLVELAIKMDSLVHNEERIRDLDHDSKDEANLDSVVEQMVNQIETSIEGNDVLIPGGWGHAQEGGHALIYQFQKTEKGLRFYTYNAGAGSSTHEQWSTTKKEQFYPVKQYQLTHPIQRDRLKKLIRQLILPQLIKHPSRDKAGFDSIKLDTAIKRDLALLGAESIDISKHISREMATTGQLSGTCSQRSIHQMLKLNFDNLANYQRFMVGFKLHALHDFINTHQPPRTKAIADLLKVAIENTLKLLQASTAFTEEEQDTATNELIQLKEAVMAEDAIKLSEPRTSILQPETEYKLIVRNTVNQQRTTADTTQHAAPAIPKPTLIPDIISIKHDSPLLDQLEIIVTKCKAMEPLDPLWVSQQIEKTLLQLPLPDENLTYYQEVSSPEDVERIRSYLELLQTTYLSAYQKSYGSTKLPSMYVTHWSFLALHDHFEIQQAAQQNRPTFHHYIEDQFRIIWSELRNSPTLATYHPDSDQRIQQLMHHYQISEKRIKFMGDFFRSHYMEIFNAYPKLKKKLEHFHALKEWRYATLHRFMVEQGASALIYLSEALKTNDPSFEKDEFEPLLNAIEQQMKYEKFIARSLHAISDYSEITNEQFEFTWSPYDALPYVKTELNNPLDDDKQTHIHYPELQYQYDQNRSTASAIKDESIFRRRQGPPHKSVHKMSSNEIQVYAHGASQDAQITKSDYHRREPYHLRTSIANQINLTIDDFKSAINKLEDTNNQTCLSDNLFQPALLHDLLQNDPNFIQRFDELIQTGFQEFMDEHGVLNNKSLFLIRLSTYFNRYIAELYPAIAEARLKNQQAQLQGLLETQRDPQVIWTIHHYHFITLMARYQLSSEVEQQDSLSEALLSHLYLNNHVGAASSFELTQLQHAFKAWLQKMPAERLASVIKTILPILGIVIPDCQIEGTYPLFTISNSTQSDRYSIEVESGRIFKDNLQYSNSLPSWINQSQVLSQFPDLKSEHPCLISHDGNCVELIAMTIPTRIIRTPNGMSIQKKWVINDQEDWYALQPLHKNQKTKDSSPAIEHNLPVCLTDNSIKIWVNKTGQAILTRHDVPIYHTNETGHLQRFDNHQILTPSTDQRLLSFEDPKFFCANLDPTNHCGTIDFIRYGLSLNMINDHIILSNTAYELTSTDTSPFDPMVACLNFSDGSNQKCIVAVQRAHVDPNRANLTSGEYYPLIHDRAGYIKTKENKTSPQNYENTEVTITYPIVNGKPKPNNAADALYLCYIYLMTHKTEEAWAVLDDLNKRFSLEGNDTELKYLAWIVNALPVTFKDDPPDINQETQLATPRYIVCQLKALSLLTSHLNQGKTLSSPFTEDLSSSIYRLYVQLQRMRRHLSVHYTLTDHESKSLLHYYHQEMQEKHERNQEDKEIQKAFTVLGAMGYEWRNLTLKKLYLECQRLSALCNIAKQANKPLPIGISQRLVDLQKEFEKNLDVMSIETRLEQVPITIPAYNSSKFDLRIIPRLDEPEISILVEQAIAALPLPMSDADFSKYMLIYLRIALEPSHPARQLLEERCHRFLIANYHDRNFAENSIQLNVLKLIYSVLHNTPHLVSQCNQLITPLKLGDLPEMLKRCPKQPPIMIYQAQNVFDTILASTRDILDTVEKETPVSVPLHTAPWILPESFTLENLIQTTERTLTEKTQNALHALQMKYRAAEALTELQRKKLSRGSLSYEEQEHTSGQFKYQCDQTQRKLAKLYLNDPEVREALHQNALTCHDAIEETLTTHWQNSLKLANSYAQTMPFKMELASGLRRDLTQSDLLILYFHADQTLYQEMTGILDPEKISELHQLIHQSVTLEVQKQHIKRLMNALDVAKELKSDSALYQIANTLMAVNHTKAQADPPLMLFQYYENILLRPRQINALTNLLATEEEPHSYHEAVEKIIMGGGKSKVILPLLAQKKATGTNLVIIEVPRALLATNHHDLNETSQRLFGQRAFLFDFNRDSDCSPKQLEIIHQHFIDVMTDKAYLVTTGESMQSLELKYLELILNKPDVDVADWEKQVFWLGKIVNLLKYRSDVIIDEVHQGLLLKKKLNYTLGNQTKLNPEFIRHSIDLYEFIEKIDDVNDLTNALIESPDSPLRASLQTFNPSFKDELRAYLNNEYESENIQHASRELKDAFAFYKEQTTLLPQTLSRKHKANYGPSQVKQKNPAIQAIAIPYVANNKPNERSRFGNPLETVNYTIQSVLLDGLSPELLSTLILKWQTEARQEWKINYPKYANFNQTPTACRLKPLFAGTGFTLQTIDAEKPEHIKQLLPNFQHHRPTLFEALKTQVLTEITVEPEILHSDAYNHVTMYRTVQGLSGTPSNHPTYHQRLQFNHENSLGTDGYIQNVLRGKHTLLHGVDFITLPAFLNDVFEKLKNPLNARAFIDINATFIGISNRTVAEALAEFVIINNPDIHYILYFNNENNLYALNVKEPGVAIPFDQIIDYKPEHCFTYYDQDHTVGIDLKQATNATGVVFVDEKTQIQSFLQGGMRIRGLENEQTLEIIMPTTMQAHTLDSMMTMMEENERHQLAEDNFFAALSKMDNLVREHLLGLINGLDEADCITKNQWAQAFKPFLVEKQNISLYERYGAIYREQATVDVFEAHKAHLIDRWIACLASIHKKASQEDINSLQTAMTTIILTALPNCKPRSIHQARGAYETAVEMQKEQETMKERQQLKEQEILVNMQHANTRHTPCAHISWDSKSLTQFSQAQPSTINMQSLNEASMSTISYSPELMVSSNFTKVYREQKQMIGPYMNPVQTILFRMHNGQLTACLINNQEAEELYHLLPKEHVWMTTTQHTLLAGERPDRVLKDPTYQALIEQVRFFSGEWRSLQQQKTPFLWLNEQVQEKLDYFEQHLLPFREIARHEFDQINPMIVNKVKEQGTEIIEATQDDNETLSRIDPHKHEDNTLTDMLSNTQQVKLYLESLSAEVRFTALTVENKQGEIPLHLALDHLTTFDVILASLSAEEQFNALMVKNKKGQTLLDVIIGFSATRDMIKLHYGWYDHFSLTSSGLLSDVAVGSQNMFRYYLKNWPDTWTDGLESKKINQDLAERHQDRFNLLMNSVSDDVRLKLLKTIAAKTNFALALDLSFNYPITFKQLLYDLPQTERLEVLRKKNHEGFSLIDMAAENELLFEILLDSLPAWERHKVRVDEEGNNELHLAVNDEETFRHMLYLIPASERLDALMEKNKLDQTIVDLALEHSGIYKILSESLPDLDRHGLIVDKDGNIALHRSAVAADDILFRDQLLAIPEPYRFQLLMKKNKQGDTVLRLAMDNPVIYEILLDALPDEERYKMFMDKDSGMRLHDLIKPYKIDEKTGKTTLLGYWDFEVCVKIIKSLPPKYRVYALTINGEETKTLLEIIKSHCAPSSLIEIFSLLSPMDLLQIDKDRDGNNKLHLATYAGLREFQNVLYTLAPEDRITALMMSNNPECTLRSEFINTYSVWSSLDPFIKDSSHYSKSEFDETKLYYIDVANESIIELPIKSEENVNTKKLLSNIKLGSKLSDDDLKVITSLTDHTHTKTALQLALDAGITLSDILNTLPESDRPKVAFSAMNIKLKEGKTLLEITSKEGWGAFQSLLHLLAPQDRLAVLLTRAPEKYSDKEVTIFERVLSNGVLFSDIINELPETDHQQAVLNMLDTGILHNEGLSKFQSFIRLLAPQDRLAALLTSTPEKYSDKSVTIFELALRNGILFSDIINELPESEHEGAVLSMLGVGILHQVAGDINTTKFILRHIPQDKLECLKTKDENGYTFFSMNAYSGANIVDFCKMLQEVLPENILLDLLNEHDLNSGASILGFCMSIESLKTILSLFPMNKRFDALIKGQTFTYILQRFQVAGLDVMVKSLPPDQRLLAFEKFIDMEQEDMDYYIENNSDASELNQVKAEFCKFTDLLKKELPEAYKLEIAMIKQTFIIASGFYELKESLKKLKTLLVLSRENMDKMNLDTQHPIHANEYSIDSKAKSEHVGMKFFQQANHRTITPQEKNLLIINELTISVLQIIESYKQLESTIQACENDPPDDADTFNKMVDHIIETAGKIRSDLYGIEGVSDIYKEPLTNSIKIAQNLGYTLDARIDQLEEKLEQFNVNINRK